MNNIENKHINLINKIIFDIYCYCDKCWEYQISWCNCKFTCLRCVNLGDYLANRNCHCKYEAVNRYRNSNPYDDELTDEELEEDEIEENFFNTFDKGENFSNSTRCYCPMCELETGTLNISFQFEPAACNTYYGYNDVEIYCTYCGFSHKEEATWNDDDLFSYGLEKYKENIESKLKLRPS